MWNGNWAVQFTLDGRQKVEAVADHIRLSFDADDRRKLPVIHGENGISQKSAGAGHASHYISYTRLATEGRWRLTGRSSR